MEPIYLRVRGAASIARTALEAAQAQHTALPGEKLAAAMVARLAKGILALNEEIAELDALIEARFHDHPHATVVRSMPGMGPMLGATRAGTPLVTGLADASDLLCNFGHGVSPPTAVQGARILGLRRDRARFQAESQTENPKIAMNDPK